MAMNRFLVWTPVVAIPTLILLTVAVDRALPRILGPAWHARHGAAAETTLTIAMMIAIVAAIVLPAVGLMVIIAGGSPRERRIRKYGRLARATVVAMGENSGGGVVTINDQPYLNLVVRVEEGPGAPYEASFDLIIPRAAVPQLQPGAAVMVKVDPRDPRKVVLSE